jgi:putative photosynthetic complex assembly protein 2
MLQVAFPVLGAILAWWLSTGLVLFLLRLPRRTHRWTLAGATAALAAALWGLSRTADDTSESGAYIAFACTIVAWGWQEVCFLTGVAIGPRTSPCPDRLGGWRRFVAAAQAILFHELQLVALGVAVAIVTAGGANLVALWTYAVLWVMRLSAKLNLFLGVPFLHDDWLPDHLRYLASYFRMRPMNWLFPLSVSAATIVAFMAVQAATGADVAPFDATARLLVAALLGLAVLEHWFMVLPLPVAALWSAFRTRREAEPVAIKDMTLTKGVVFPTPTINRRGT